MLKKLRASNSEYDKSITFVLIDWDTFKSDSITTSRKIARRSTLVLIKGGVEIGRLVAQASEQKLRAFIDAGLN